MSGPDRVHRVVAQADRLDRLVAPWCASRARAQAAVQSGKVRVDGRIVRDPGAHVAAGARLELWWNAPGTSVERTEGLSALAAAGVRVVAWMDAAVVCDKPPGLLTDAATVAQRREEPSLVGLLRRPSAPHRPIAVHRIDRDTSGLVLVARGENAYEDLRAEFAAHRPDRRYLALLQGELDGAAGRWEDRMVWDGAARIQRAPRPHEDAPVAWADWRLLARGQGATLVEVRLGTGRRNQIRVHAAWRGHPLVGERLYLPPGHAPGVGAARQCLHAAELAVRTPDGREGRWTAPLPRDFAAVLRGVGISASA